MSSRWQRAEVSRGADYDARWRELAAEGRPIHGEADLVETLLTEIGGRSVLDAGCGTGRVAIELAERGMAVVGIDSDEAMLAEARAKAPRLRWVPGDLAGLAESDPGDTTLPGSVDLVLLAGNVMLFVEPGSEGRVLAGLARLLRPGGLLVAGFSVRPGELAVADYDRLAAAAGLEPRNRWATWERAPFAAGGDYAVSVHRKT